MSAATLSQEAGDFLGHVMPRTDLEALLLDLRFELASVWFLLHDLGACGDEPEERRRILASYGRYLNAVRRDARDVRTLAETVATDPTTKGAPLTPTMEAAGSLAAAIAGDLGEMPADPGPQNARLVELLADRVRRYTPQLVALANTVRAHTDRGEPLLSWQAAVVRSPAALDLVHEGALTLERATWCHGAVYGGNGMWPPELTTRFNAAVTEVRGLLGYPDELPGRGEFEGAVMEAIVGHLAVRGATSFFNADPLDPDGTLRAAVLAHLGECERSRERLANVQYGIPQPVYGESRRDIARQVFVRLHAARGGDARLWSLVSKWRPDTAAAWTRAVARVVQVLLANGRIRPYAEDGFSDLLRLAKAPKDDRRHRLKNRASDPRPLTARQTEVIQVIGECKGNVADAARRLGLSHKTVRQHHKAACKKLGYSAIKTKPKTKKMPHDHRGQPAIAAHDEGPANHSPNRRVPRDRRR